MINKIKLLGVFTILIIIFSSSAASINLKSIDANTENNKIINPNFISADVYVDDDADPSWYDETHVKTIQEGVDNATEYENIFVYNGTYFEHVVIYKPVNLTGENKDSTIIDGQFVGSVVKIISDGVSIQHFNLINSGYSEFSSGIRVISNYTTVKNNKFNENSDALLIFPGLNSDYILHDNIVENNLFINNHGSILLFDTNNNSVFNNEINNIDYLLGYGGIYLLLSDNNSIFNNSISNLSYSGAFGIGLAHSKKNIISNNEIENIDEEGIICFKSHLNMFYNNEISKVNKYGIYIEESEFNEFCHNNINSCYNGIHIIRFSNNNKFCYNNIKNITKKAIYIEDSNFNKIRYNNIINCIIKATFLRSSFNCWYKNYWGRFRFLPKPIFGRKGKLFSLIPWVNYDFFPAKTPNEI